MNLIPDFKPGDRVIAKTQPLEVKCKICERHAACYVLYQTSAKAIILSRADGISCPCCGASNYLTAEIYLIKVDKPILNRTETIFGIPYTWLEPLGESLD